MRKRIPYRVCSCTPQGVVTHMEARLLRRLVNREIHPMRCAYSAKQTAMKALRAGDLCAETGHFLWAIKMWYLGMDLVCMKDYNEWRDVWFNMRVVRLRDVLAEEDARILGRRIDSLWRALGYNEMGGYAGMAKASYDWLWLEKYDYDRNYWYYEYVPQFETDYERMQAEETFRQGQVENMPPCAQDFFEYWDHGPFLEDISWIYDND